MLPFPVYRSEPAATKLTPLPGSGLGPETCPQVKAGLQLGDLHVSSSTAQPGALPALCTRSAPPQSGTRAELDLNWLQSPGGVQL